MSKVSAWNIVFHRVDLFHGLKCCFGMNIIHTFKGISGSGVGSRREEPLTQ